jgi:hypothetical protein
MIRVSMSRADWETVVYIMAEVQKNGMFAYIDNIIDTIDHALDTQEN